MPSTKVGMITIGQSPRDDLVPEMREIIGPDAEVLEAGALDGLSLEQVKRLSPRARDYRLCTRMADGTEVVIGKKHILGRVQNCIHRLEAQGADLIVLLCTGKFPAFTSRRFLVESQKIMDHAISALCGKGDRVGVMVPLAEQIEQARRKYRGLEVEITFQAASPYAPQDEVARAALALRQADPQIVFMHCMGYTQGMKEKVRSVTGRPTVLAKSIVARTVRELLG